MIWDIVQTKITGLLVEVRIIINQEFHHSSFHVGRPQ